MRRLGFAMLVFALFCWVATPAMAAVLKVPTGFLTIQDAINAASPGDTIVIHDGLYNENLKIIGKNNLHLVAAQVPANVGVRAVGIGASFPFGVQVVGVFDPGTPCLLIEDSHRVSIVGLAFTSCEGPGIRVLGTGPPIRDVRLYSVQVDLVNGAGIEILNARRVQVLSSEASLSNSSSGLVVDGIDCLVADSVFANSLDAGVLVTASSNRTQVINNAAGGNSVGIYDLGSQSRVERNSAFSNPSCDIDIAIPASFADIAGNEAGVYCLGGIMMSPPPLGENM